MRQLLLSAFVLLLASVANAAPPPPPPEFVYDAMTALSGHDATKVARLFADDVTVFENGKMIAAGKDIWLSQFVPSIQNRSRRVIGYSEGFRELLVIDTYDTVDRNNLPPTFLADPRMATRSTLYQFGQDQLIHTVRISSIGSFFVMSRN